MTEPADRLSDEVLEQIARKGVAYTREARLMAKELLERRRQEAQSFNPYANGIGGICP